MYCNRHLYQRGKGPRLVRNYFIFILIFQSTSSANKTVHLQAVYCHLCRGATEIISYIFHMILKHYLQIFSVVQRLLTNITYATNVHKVCTISHWYEISRGKGMTEVGEKIQLSEKISYMLIRNSRSLDWEYRRITYNWTVPLILNHLYLVGKLTSSKIADTKVSGF
jgi:hypothetical protein